MVLSLRMELYRMHMVRGEHGKQYFKFIVVRNPFVREAQYKTDGSSNPNTSGQVSQTQLVYYKKMAIEYYESRLLI